LRRKKENKARKSERKRNAIQVAVRDELQIIFAAVSDWALGTKTNDAAVLSDPQVCSAKAQDLCALDEDDDDDDSSERATKRRRERPTCPFFLDENSRKP
jgi:hypothetical protein